jgi:hypothetical protein
MSRKSIPDNEKKRSYSVTLTQAQKEIIIKKHGSLTDAILKTIKKAGSK